MFSIEALFGRRIRLPFAALLIASAILLGASGTAGATSFRLTVLGSIPGYRLIAVTGVNPSGQVVGNFVGGGAAFSATAAGGVVMLGSLPGYPYSTAVTVNPSGQVFGIASNSGGGAHAFSWTKAGGMVDRGAVPGDSWVMSASGGYIAGEFQNAAGGLHAFLWTPTGVTFDVGTLNGDSQSKAYAVNDHSQVVGWGFSDQGLRGFSWTAQGGIVDLGGRCLTSGGLTSCNTGAFDVSDNGQVVGSELSATGAGSDAFSWTPGGGMVDLGTLPGDSSSYASAVNTKGQVVGFADAKLPNGASSNQRAFSWTQSGGITALPVPTGTPSSFAEAVNDHGQVAGPYLESHGVFAIALWSPSSLPLPLARTQLLAVHRAGRRVQVTVQLGSGARRVTVVAHRAGHRVRLHAGRPRLGRTVFTATLTPGTWTITVTTTARSGYRTPGPVRRRVTVP